MDFTPALLTALLIGLPLAFGIGWWSSRMDARQWKRSTPAGPRAYLKGLNLLLADEHDKAIDAFIEALQQDPDTAELHFALGNLFRRRGEFERAVRVHEHLLQRADLKPEDRERAHHALAQDFMKAGLFDRAQAAWEQLAGSHFDTDARLALLALHERARDWQAATETARALERNAAGSFARRISHHLCEQALEADDAGDPDRARALIDAALEADPQAPRPWLLRAEREARAGRPGAALAAYHELRRRDAATFGRVSPEAADVALRWRDQDGGDDAAAAAGSEAARHALLRLREAVQRKFETRPSHDLLQALARLDGQAPGDHPAWAQLMAQQPSLTAALDGLHSSRTRTDPQGLQAIESAVGQAARPQHRFRCAACHFESTRHFWQCPVCLSWDSLPPRRTDES